MTTLNSLNHANHNYSACNYMTKKQEYCDWIITIAFYSAVHFVRHKLLPYQDMGTTYNTFDSLFKTKKEIGEGRHGFQLRYVKDEIPEISFEYARLHEWSTNARYINYNYGRDDSKKAKEYLDKIKETCCK